MTIAALLGVVLAVLRFIGIAPLALLDARAIDLRLLARGRQPGSPEAVIVAVDDASIAEIGRWPWPRATLARLLDKIEEGGPSVVGFDIVQSEATAAPDLTSLKGRVGDQALAEVSRALADGSPDDRALADSIAKSGNVVLGYFFDRGGSHSGGSNVAVASYAAVQSEAGESGETKILAAKTAVTNIPAIAAAAKSNGFFNSEPDPDGYYRRVPAVMSYGDRMALPLSLSMLQVVHPDWQARLRIVSLEAADVRLGPHEIPVREDGQMLLNFRGPGGTFRRVSAADLLAGRADPATLLGKAVIVGVTATAVADIRATPFDGIYPGVELHATVIDNVLRDDLLSQPRWIVLVEIGAILASVLVLGAALARVQGVAAALVALSLVVGYLGLSQWLFLAEGVPLGIVYPLVAIALVYMTISLHHFVTVEREKRRTREAFSRYLNPELARMVSENPDLLALGGTRRCLTVLFSDIRGFTSISEGLEPETLVEILNVYLGEMTGIVFEHEGTLDKYIGDAIMAVWGAPVECTDHAMRACAAALDMSTRLRQRSEEWTSRGWPRIEAGIGIHTGDMVSGNMGSASHLSYTVIGDNVNLGSRLEGLTKTYGVSLLVSEAVCEQAGDAFVTRELDVVAVKGKALPVRIFELVGRAADAASTSDLVTHFATALGLFRKREWARAEAAFMALLEAYPGDGPSNLYVKRCRIFASDPPPADWAGVTVMETK
ncbi:MAG TPA: adenylate/guanylate cyclase domain-containing protein [Candidatus Binatia bacterium]